MTFLPFWFLPNQGENDYFIAILEISEIFSLTGPLSPLEVTVTPFSSGAKWWVFIADDLGFLGPGSPDLMTELCPPQDTA